MNREYYLQKEVADYFKRRPEWVCRLVRFMRGHPGCEAGTVISSRMIHLEKTQAFLVRYGHEFSMRKASGAQECTSSLKNEG